MKPILIYFTSHHFKTSEEWVKSILRLTPGSKGIWKNIRYTFDPKESDFYLIMDGTNEILPDMKKKAIFMYEHPYTPCSPTHKGINQTNCLLNLPLTDYLNFGELWIEYDYDYLMQLKPKDVNRDLICVATYQTHHFMYAQRQIFLEALVKEYPNIDLDIYGRPIENYDANETLKPFYRGCLGNNTYDATKGEHIVGKNVIENYKYTLEYDVGPTNDYYVSERFWDSLMMWCTPIYFGCNKVNKFLPYENMAYFKFDQHNLNDVHKIANIIQEPKYFKELQECRMLYLNKFQLFAYCHFIVNNIDSMINSPQKTFWNWIKS